MKKIITMAVLIFSSMLTYACTSGTEQKQAETQKTAQDGSVIVNEQSHVHQGYIRLREVQRVEI